MFRSPYLSLPMVKIIRVSIERFLLIVTKSSHFSVKVTFLNIYVKKGYPLIIVEKLGPGTIKYFLFEDLMKILNLERILVYLQLLSL